MTTAATTVADNYDVNNVNPGTLGFVVVALLGVALWFLLKSMTRHIGKVDFDESAQPTTPPRAADVPPKGPPAV